MNYFAAMNSNHGFVSFFEETFSDKKLDKLYIIYGAPGTGKSSFMRSLSDRIDGNIDKIYCSSDIHSLDGIIINNEIAVADGTSPHFISTKYPGAFEEIVDFTACWNEKHLERKRDEIISLAAKKSNSYKEAYRYLKAAYDSEIEIQDEYYSKLDYYFIKDKAKQIIASFPESKDFITETRLFESISCEGNTIIDGYIKPNTSKITVSGNKYAVSAFLKELSNEAAIKKVSHYRSFKPENNDLMNGIYLPEENIIFTGCEYYKEIYTTDSIDLKSDILDFSLTEKVIGILRDCAVSHLKYASEYHFELEKIYIESMNYKKLDLLLDRVFNKINKDYHIR